MQSYGVLRQTIKRCVILVGIGCLVAYFMTGHVKQGSAFYRIPSQEIKSPKGYEVIARYIDKNKIVTEQVMFYTQKNEHSAEKMIRNGILVTRPQAKATILMCHGFGCSKRDIAFLGLIFPQYNIMTFDFRAHGEQCEGQYCTLGKDEAYDVLGAAHVIKHHERTAHLPVLLYGFSMGAVSAIEAQAKDASLFSAMILDCPFDSVQNLIKRGLDNLKITVFGYEIPLPGRSLLEKCAFNQYTQPIVQALLKLFAGIDSQGTPIATYHVHPEESIKKVQVPCFFIHCKNDEKVPVDAIKQVFDNAGTHHKKLWITGGRRHFDSLFHEPYRYAKKAQKFFDMVLTKKYETLAGGVITDDSGHPRAEVF